MKTNELRIGNLIYGVSDRIEQVVCIWPSLVSSAPPLLKEAEYASSDDLNGIPLTEEWLRKFGAIKDEDGLYHLRNENWRFYLVRNFIQVCGSYAALFNSTHTIYVHHLQNLYFVITNEELTLKENI